MTDFMTYSAFYILFIMGLLYPPKEFVSAGLTIPEVFSSWLGLESLQFIQYHLRRSVLTLFIHSLLPLGYVLGLAVLGHINTVQILLSTEYPVWYILALFSTIPPMIVLYKILIWLENNWQKHPTVQRLAVHCSENETWLDVARNINREFNNINKLQISTNTVTKVVVTDNWLIQVAPYKLHLAHQSNSTLICYQVNVYPAVATTIDNIDCAYVKYKVCNGQPRGEDFMIRLNHNDVENFVGKVTMQITILPSAALPKKLVDLYMDWIKEEVTKNPPYVYNEELDICSVCTNATSNVKLVRRCPDIPTIDGVPACESCLCPPRSCINCLIKWFLASSTSESAIRSRQIEDISQLKGSCPQCRSTFCIRDISYVESSSPN